MVARRLSVVKGKQKEKKVAAPNKKIKMQSFRLRAETIEALEGLIKRINKKSKLKINKTQTLELIIIEAMENLKKKKTTLLKDKILLTIPGKMKRTDDCDRSYQIYLRKDIQNDLDIYCIGNMQSLMNYLVRRGLDDLIKKGQQVIEKHV